MSDRETEEFHKTARLLREAAEQLKGSRQYRKADELAAQARVMEEKAREANRRYVNWLWGYG